MTDDMNESFESSEPVVPVKVVSVDELVDRLVSSSEPQAESAGEGGGEEDPPEPSLSDQWFTLALRDNNLSDVVVQLQEIKYMLRDEFAAHDILTTKFEDYTVTEGLLLSILLCIIGGWCIKMLKGAFSWLLW